MQRTHQDRPGEEDADEEAEGELPHGPYGVRSMVNIPVAASWMVNVPLLVL